MKKTVFSQIITLLLLCLLCDSCMDSTNDSVVQDAISKQDTTTITDKENLLAEVVFDDTTSERRKKKLLDMISKKYLMGQFDPAMDDRFCIIPAPYANKSMYLRKETLAAFVDMYEAAKKDGIDLLIISATRPFDVQKSIWEAKWTGKRKVDGAYLSKSVKDSTARATKILRWSSMPSTSRHHWGTDIDINNLEPEYFESGKGLQEYEWLVANTHRYGFCQVYSKMDESRPYGYQEEKWHWSYLPISKELTNAYAKQINDKDISGFLGSETATSIEIVKKYVLGINPDCL